MCSRTLREKLAMHTHRIVPLQRLLCLQPLLHPSADKWLPCALKWPQDEDDVMKVLLDFENSVSAVRFMLFGQNVFGFQ